jgi:hypothetical protein
MAGALCLLSATNASAALSGTFNASGSTTGNTVISGLTTGPFTVGVSGPGFCVGPPNACGTGNGLSGSTSVSGAQVTFGFAGSTAGAGPGSFTINLTGFTSPITGVSFASGGLGGATITDSVLSSSSLRFTFTTTSDYNAIGGNTVVFNVTTAAVPEPSSVVLLSTFLAGAVFIGRRRLLVRGSRA